MGSNQGDPGVRGECGAAEVGTYKALGRSGPKHLGKSEGLIVIMKPTDSITSTEGRSPASVGRSLGEEGPVTATGKSLLAQRTIKKVRVLQETLYRAAKENPRRTFGVLYDKVCRWEVLWEAWCGVIAARRESMAELSRPSRRRERSRS